MLTLMEIEDTLVTNLESVLQLLHVLDNSKGLLITDS